MSTRAQHALTPRLWLCMVVVIPGSVAGGFHASNLGLLPIMGLACICVEQLTVVIAARALGDRVLAVYLGVGPEVFRIPIRGLGLVSFRVLPVLGTTVIITARGRGQRTRTGIAILAGVVVLIGAIAALLRHEGATLHGLQHRLASSLAFDITFHHLPAPKRTRSSP